MPDSHHFTWPRLPDIRHRVACHFCDTLHEVKLIEEGRAAHCQECGHVLYRNRRSSLQRAAAYGITALSLFFLMLLFPFITMEVQGTKSAISVTGAILSLWQEGGQLIAFSVALFVLVLPGSQSIMCTFQAIKDWVMVEVFFLGVIISLLKLVKLAEVQLGIGFWAVAGLMLCIAGAVGGIDKTELWDRIEFANFKKGKERA